jgi:hypothetical protein
MKLTLALIVLSMTLVINPGTANAQKQVATQDNVMMLDVQSRGNLDEVVWYVTDDIEIERQVEATSDLDIKKLQEKGKLSIQNGKYYERYIVTGSATGLLEKKEGESLFIRFEAGEGRFLEFKLSTPEKNETVRYYKLVVTDRPDGKLTGGNVRYAGHQWRIIEGSYVGVEFKAKISSANKVQTTKIRGLNKDGTEKKGLLDFKKN